MKVYGALELAQLEWFLDSAKPSAASFIYRVIYVSDLKQIQVSDGTNWIPFLNTSTNQTLSGDITFSGQQIFNGLHRLSVTTNSATGAIVALAPTTPITEFTGAVTSVSGVTSGASGATVMFINRSGSPFTVLDEDAGATAGNRIRTGTGASITLTNNASILLSYAGDSRWHVVGGTGSSSAGGAKNYFAISSANPNFSQNSVSPWSACTLTFTSGVPSGAPTLTATQMAIAATATNPLLQSQSNYNLQLVKSGAAQYQGFISGELTIDREDLAKVLTGSFSYEVASGTVTFSGTSTQDLEIWVYNTVSGAWTQPAGFRGMNTSSGTGVVSFTFQTDSTAANNKYKIAVITQQTSATAYSVNFNDFSVGPTVVVNGTPVTDWVSYTPTGSWTANTNYAGKYRRVGDTMDVSILVSCTGAPTAANLTVNIPSFATIDTSKLTSSSGYVVSVVGGGNSPAVGIFYSGFILNSTTISISYLQDSSAQDSIIANVTNLLPVTAANGTQYSINFQVPIVGWSSNVQISSDTDTRVVAASYNFPSTAVAANTDIANIWTRLFDTHSAFTNSTGRYVASVSGIYRVSFISSKATTGSSIFVLRNGSSYTGLFSYAIAGGIFSGSTTISLNAGDYITFQANGAITIDGSFSVERISGPSVIAASESVNASYFSTSTGAMAVGTPATVIYGTRNFDSHNAYNTTTGVYTFPVSGKYLVTSNVTSTSTTQVQSLVVDIFRIGTGAYNRNSVSRLAAVSSALVSTQSTIVNANAGETLDIRVAVTSGTGAFDGTAIGNNFTIARIGN
jgi:hypothetical protein